MHVPADPARVLTRAREVMAVMLREPEELPSTGRSEYLDAWRDLLPGWFVESFRDELTLEQEEAEEREWFALSLEERERLTAAEQEPWILSRWLQWWEPDSDLYRQWRWWEARTDSPGILRLFIEVNGWPTALDHLEWVLRVAGATDVDLP